MSHPFNYVWQGRSYQTVPHFKQLYSAYQHNYTEFVDKDWYELTSAQQLFWDRLGGRLSRARDLARERAKDAGESVAHLSFEMPAPDRSSEPGGTVPERAVHKGDLKKSTKRPRRPTQSQSAPAFIPPPPPPATRPVQVAPSVPVQYQPPTMFTLGAMGPQPKPKPARAARRRKQSPYHRAVITPPPAASGSAQHESPKTSTRGAMGPPMWTPSHPLEYYQYNDPTCPIPEGDLPGPRSNYLFPLWLAYQKKAKAKAEEEEEEEARALLAKAQAEEVEVVERRVCAVKDQEIKPIAWADYKGVIDPALLALG
ncbi:hypothetical protein CPB85DRAFT_1336061 [Mucidula mucida]|nr:hypothetical protein CPB85DRAFT_1336061 [Mucidula mucida]